MSMEDLRILLEMRDANALAILRQLSIEPPVPDDFNPELFDPDAGEEEEEEYKIVDEEGE